MSFSTIIIEEGHRNYIVQVTGTGPDAAGTVLIDVAALVPAADAVRLMRVSYDCGAAEVVKLTFDGDTDPFLVMTEGNGQTICYKKIGGIPNRGKGNVLIESATGTYSMTLHFIKQRPNIPL